MNRREFIKIGAAAAIGVGVASAIEIPLLESNTNPRIADLEKQQTQLTQKTAFLTLNPKERKAIEALAETIIPTDSTGPGAKEAGVIYFIDRMLAGNYGKGGNMYLQGPFIHPQTGALSVMGAVYPSTTKVAISYDSTIAPRLQAGTSYQYAFSPREFWRRGLVSLQNYCNAAKGGKNFEDLSSAEQTAVLQELFDNSSGNTTLQTAFAAPNAAEFFNEVHDLVVAGFWSDPIYGGNQNMVGWELIAFNGNYWGDNIGLGAKKLMVAGTPTRLKPKSLGQFQQEGGGI